MKLATASQASKTMMRAMPILRAMPENKKVLMAPQCRYLRPCCDDQAHCTNCEEELYRRKLLDGIKDIRRALKDLCHDERIHLYKVVNPCGILGLYEESRSWESSASLGSDPVHLAGGGYAKLAEGIVKQVEEDAVDFNGGKRGREDEQEGEEMGQVIPGRKA